MEQAQLFSLALQAINQRDYVKAHQACVTAVKQFGDSAQAYFLLGIIHIEIMQIGKAVRLLEKSLSLAKSAETYAYLAKCHSLTGDLTQALAAADAAPVALLDKALALDTVGVALSRVGVHDKALAYFSKALTLEPNNPAFHYNYAVSAKFDGDFSAARTGFEKAIALAPDYHQAHFALSDLGGVSAENNHIARLNAVDARITDVDGKLHIAHALAKEFEALKDFDSAFGALNSAKKRKVPQFSGVEAQYQAMFDFLMKSASSSAPTVGADSARPIFVIGMPRSGTTLVERIISNHSMVGSGGELQDFGVAVKELTGTASNAVLDLPTLEAAENLDFTKLGERYLQRTQIFHPEMAHLVDKLPFNFFYVGLIRRALPNAKIVCLLRDPMDTCIGNFRQLFSLNSPYYAYSYDLESIGRFYCQFYALVHEWNKFHPDSVRLQSYETLARNPDREIRDLLEFCGLPFEEQCLRAESNSAPVSTASKVQVREAINTRSIGRWKQYGDYTASLEALVAGLSS